ncbi:MAG: hypothetical protein IKE27_00720 [Oscillospiraceae bacterium]|nr:hypothetical protein [Oscillospiraceae bacterium]
MYSTLNTLKPERVYDIDDVINTRPEELIASSEAEYQAELDSVAEMIAEKNARFVLLTGPSSSGKTTTTRRLGLTLEGMGRHTIALSLDDFSFLYRKTPPEFYNGKPYYEGISNINIDLLHERLRELFDTGKAYTPIFDFKTGQKNLNGSLAEIGPEDIILVEGIQALIPVTAEGFDDITQFRVYAGIRGRYERNGNVVADPEQIRFIRRLVRDAYFRRSIADRTFDIWSNVLVGNEINIWPYLETVDAAVNTSFAYEGCVMTERLKKLLNDPNRVGTKAEGIKELIDMYSPFPEYDFDLVPKNSMLREFIGGLEL